MSYHVHLEVYDGPFDLLLQLIARRRLEITEIDLAEITQDFLQHLGEALDELDLESATRFLVVAATLVELKAARLLPRDERDEVTDLLGDARDMLYARLLEYRAFRDVARLMEHGFDRYAGSLAREAPPEPWLLRLVPDVQLPIDATGLAALAAAATAPRPAPEIDLTHIRRTYLTIREAAREVLDALGSVGSRVEYSALVSGRDRGDRVVLFLALLELFKLGHVELDQPDLHRSMAVERRDGREDLASLTDEYETPTAGDEVGASRHDVASDRPSRDTAPTMAVPRAG